MQIRAENDPRYWRRFWIMGVCAIGFAFYCLYDGVVGYPNRRERGFEEFKTDYKSRFSDDRHKAMTLEQFEVVTEGDLRENWDHYAHDRDIPSKPDVVMQFIMAAAAGGAGLFFLSLPLRARGRWVELNNDGVFSSWGESFHFDQIELVNKRKWRDKGIAKVTYRDGASRKRVFVIDDYKFDRYRMDALMYLVEQRIDAERIANGPPEEAPEPDSEVAKALKAAK
jgi:hypothetical protein